MKNTAKKITKQLERQDNTEHLDKIGTETLLALLSSRTKSEAAEKLSIARSALYQRIIKYGLEKHLEAIPKQALQTLQMGSDRAAETLVHALDDRINKMEAAKEILDRVGVTNKAPTVLQQFNVGQDMGVKFEVEDANT